MVVSWHFSAVVFIGPFVVIEKKETKLSKPFRAYHCRSMVDAH